VRDGVDLSEGQEGDLVVGVVRSSTKGEKCGQRFVGEVTGGNGTLEGREESGSFDGQHQRDQDTGGHGSQDSVKVLGIEVFSDGLSGHSLLGKDTTGGGGDVRKHSRGKCKDGEGKFLHGGDGNSSNDGKKSQVYRQRKNLSQKEVVHEACNNRFRGLDNVGKGNGSSSEGDDGTNVNTGVAKSNREKSLEVGTAQLRGFAHTKKPQWDEVKDTTGHLQSSNSPWVLEDIKSLLVVDIVGNVEKVPQGEVGTDLDSFCESRFSLGSSLGSVGGKLNSSSLGPG